MNTQIEFRRHRRNPHRTQSDLCHTEEPDYEDTQGAYDVHLAVLAHRLSPLNEASARPSIPSMAIGIGRQKSLENPLVEMTNWGRCQHFLDSGVAARRSPRS